MIDFAKVKADAERRITCERKCFEEACPHVETACKLAQAYVEKYPDDTICVMFSAIYDVADIELTTVDMKRGIALRRLLREAGYHLTGDPSVNSYSYTYQYKRHQTDGSGIKLEVSPMPSDDAVCRRVQIGTREVPVYEIVCNGEAAEALWKTEKNRNASPRL